MKPLFTILRVFEANCTPCCGQGNDEPKMVAWVRITGARVRRDPMTSWGFGDKRIITLCVDHMRELMGWQCEREAHDLIDEPILCDWCEEVKACRIYDDEMVCLDCLPER